MRLDLFHLRDLSADILGHFNGFARGARVVRRGKALELRNVLRDEFVVGAEAAGGVNDSLGRHRVRAVLTLHLDARDAAGLVGDEFFSLRVRADVDVTGLGSRVKRADHFRADERAAGRTVRARERGAGHEADVAKVAAQGEEPFNGGSRLFSERTNERRVVEPVTALHRVVVHDFDGVLSSFAALCSLKRRAGSVEAARRTDRVAADHGHLFEDDNLGAEVRGLDGSRKAGSASTDDGDVNGDVFSGVDAAHAGGNGGRNQNLLHMNLHLFHGKQLSFPIENGKPSRFSLRRFDARYLNGCICKDKIFFSRLAKKSREKLPLKR